MSRPEGRVATGVGRLGCRVLKDALGGEPDLKGPLERFSAQRRGWIALALLPPALDIPWSLVLAMPGDVARREPRLAVVTPERAGPACWVQDRPPALRLRMSGRLATRLLAVAVVVSTSLTTLLALQNRFLRYELLQPGAEQRSLTPGSSYRPSALRPSMVIRCRSAAAWPALSRCFLLRHTLPLLQADSRPLADHRVGVERGRRNPSLRHISGRRGGRCSV